MSRMIVAAFAAVLLVSGAADAGVTKGRINETGQTTSFGPGSDGDLERGLTRIFNDLGNGVIKDARTGLFWEKKSDDGGIHDWNNTYTWCKNTDGNYFDCDTAGNVMDGTMVTTFLATLNTTPCFAGYCDWRIPNRRELESIVNLEPVLSFNVMATFPAFHTGCTPGCSVATCSCNVDSGYWSSSTFRYSPDYAWYVDFTFGDTKYIEKQAFLAVRAVRGGS